MQHHNKTCLIIGDQDSITTVRGPLEMAGFSMISCRFNECHNRVVNNSPIKGIICHFDEWTEEQTNRLISVCRQYPEARVVVTCKTINHQFEKKLRTQHVVFLGDLELFHQHCGSILKTAFARF